MLSFSLHQCIYFDDTARPAEAPGSLPSLYEDAEKQLRNEAIRNNVAAKETAEPFVSDLPPGKKIKIGKIFIFNRPVTHEQGFVPGFFNFFHWTTEKYIVGNELLFEPNAETSEQLVRESERILRTLPSIKDSSIYLLPGENDIYAAAVYTHDRFTSNVRFGATGSGGYSLFHLEAGESNLFGRLYNVGITADRENFLNSFGLYAAQPRLAATKWSLTGIYANSFAGTVRNYSTQTLVLSRPFISLSDRNSFTVQVQAARGVRYSFKGGGIETGRDSVTAETFPVIYSQDSYSYSAEYLRAYGRLKRLELGGGFSEKYDQYALIPATAQYSLTPQSTKSYSYAVNKKYLPQFSDYRALHIRTNLKWGEYSIRKNFRKYFFTEDTYNGLQVLTLLRHADPASGRPDHFTEASGSVTFSFDTGAYRNETKVLRKARIWHEGPEAYSDDLLTAENRGYWFFNFGVFAQRIFWAHGNYLTRKEVLILAEEIPRGFGYREFLGNAVFLASQEYRTPPWVLGYVSCAGVVFVDVGGLADSPETLSLTPVAGVGIRLMLHEFDDNIFRIDLGVPLTNEPFRLVNAFQFGLQHTF